jgi:hypothetical protein
MTVYPCYVCTLCGDDFDEESLCMQHILTKHDVMVFVKADGDPPILFNDFHNEREII